MGARAFVRNRLDPSARYGLRLTLFAVAILLVALPFGFFLRQVTQDGWFVTIDTSAANYLHEEVVDRPWLVVVLQIISFLGSPLWFYLVVGSAAIYLWRRNRVRLAVYLATTCWVGGIIDTIVKIAVSRPRPSLEDPVATAHGQSFPSGHSMTSMVAYGALLLVFLPVVSPRRRVLVASLVMTVVALVGFSRLGLGVHYISDVLGGFLLGAAWLLASTAAFSIWRVELGKKPVRHPLGGIEPEAKRAIVKDTPLDHAQTG